LIECFVGRGSAFEVRTIVDDAAFGSEYTAVDSSAFVPNDSYGDDDLFIVLVRISENWSIIAAKIIDWFAD